jgi:hypothetical protein
MVEKVNAYFKTLEGLSTEALDQSAEKLVRLRLQVANVSRRFPQLLISLADNRISLTVAGHLAPHLREDNVEKLLSDCAGMSKRDVEEYLVALRPKPVFKPSIRKRPSLSNESEKAQAEKQPETQRETEQLEQSLAAPSAEETPSPRPTTPSPNVLEPARTDVFNFRFSADGNFKEKFERLAEVLGVENPLKNMVEVFERAVDISLEKKDPKKKRERRLARESKRGEASEKSRPDEISKPEGVTAGEEEETKSRYIPSEVRERVFERAGYQCQFQARDGTRCSSRTGLEIEHERPFAIYRSHDEGSLRVLCRRHNMFQAERVYGADFIRAKIDEKRRQKASRTNTPAVP